MYAEIFTLSYVYVSCFCLFLVFWAGPKQMNEELNRVNLSFYTYDFEIKFFS